jgi:hypothetical protein
MKQALADMQLPHSEIDDGNGTRPHPEQGMSRRLIPLHMLQTQVLELFDRLIVSPILFGASPVYTL